MKLWILGLVLILGLAIPSTNGESSDEDDEYEIKRFLIQSRALDGDPHCVETRRKRSTREADYIENIDTQSTSLEQDYISASAEQDSNAEKDVTDGDKHDEFGLKNSDLAGTSGILIVQNPSSPNVPLFFAVRPVLGNSSNKKYLQMKIFDDSSINDEDFDDYMDDYEEIPKRQNPTKKKSKRKQSTHSQIDDPLVDSIEQMLKAYKKSSNRQSNRNKAIIQALKTKLDKNRTDYRNAVQTRKDKKKISTTSSDSPPVKCIIIHKMPVMDQATDVLGISAQGRTANRNYGLRKRYKPKRFD